MDEKDLVKKARVGDKQAFCDLYMLYNDRLYRYAFYKLGNPEDAKDAVSDCIVEAYEHIATLKNDKAFSAWIFKIMYRSCCSLIKQQSKLKDTVDIDSLNENSTSYSINYENTELKQALESLSDEERDIVLLSAVAGYKTKEIANIMGLNHSTVRSKLSRSLIKMRCFME
jgi:RNA polymerase sigma-70 factor (ECF subfamily)